MLNLKKAYISNHAVWMRRHLGCISGQETSVILKHFRKSMLSIIKKKKAGDFWNLLQRRNNGRYKKDGSGKSKPQLQRHAVSHVIPGTGRTFTTL